MSIHKTGPKEDVNNYRPISILPTVSKIMEKWIHLKFMKYLNDNKLLHEKERAASELDTRLNQL